MIFIFKLLFFLLLLIAILNKNFYDRYRVSTIYSCMLDSFLLLFLLSFLLFIPKRVKKSQAR